MIFEQILIYIHVRVNVIVESSEPAQPVNITILTVS